MKKKLIVIGFSAMACLLTLWPDAARAQGGFQPVSADAFNKAVPADFYLENNRIPVEKRNAAVVSNPAGKQVVVGLLDTTGYSSQIQQKYTGMLITETKLGICGTAFGVGSYGFGLEHPPASSNGDATFRVFDQAGDKLAECGAKRDDSVKQPRPLAVSTAKGGPTKLYLGKYAVEIR